jgi:SAM-dependent methyltransferase
MMAGRDRIGSAAESAAQGDALRRDGRYDEALAAYAHALALDRGLLPARHGMTSVLEIAHAPHYHPGFASLICDCLSDPAAYHQALARPAAQQIRFKYGLDRPSRFEGAGDASLISALASDRLVLDLLTQTIVADAALERWLVELRRRLLLDPAAGNVALRAAMAVQCANNEYAWWAERDELDAVESLAERLRPEDESTVADVAMYLPLHDLPAAAAWVGRPVASCAAALRPVIQTALDHAAEKAIAARIESFGEVDDAVSRAVRKQYEENPYPRWIGLRPGSRGDLLASLRATYPYMAPVPSGRPLQVLCAGCGTGQHALSLAASYESVEITAFDLSRRSLAFASRRARDLGFDGIRLVHGDILALDRLGRRFDVVEAVGVLHHMADPTAGLARLTETLNPGGLVRLGLYGEHQRREVVEARRRIAALGLDASTHSVRLFRHRVLTDPAYGDLAAITGWPDFFSVSGTRDLLFHVHEQRFTVPRLRDMLAACGLDFVGFEYTGDASRPPTGGPTAAERYRAAFPHEPAMRSLDNWASLEPVVPDLLAGGGFLGYLLWAQRPWPR